MVELPWNDNSRNDFPETNRCSSVQAQELDFEEYQQIVAYSRNEGLFFKNLYPAPKPLHLRSSALSKSTVKEVRCSSWLISLLHGLRIVLEEVLNRVLSRRMWPLQHQRGILVAATDRCCTGACR